MVYLPYEPDGAVLLVLEASTSPYSLAEHFKHLTAIGELLDRAGKYGNRDDHQDLDVVRLQMSSPLEVTLAWASAGGGALIMGLLVYARDFQGRQRSSRARARMDESLASQEEVREEIERENLRARRAIVDALVAYVGSGTADALQVHERDVFERALVAMQALPVLEVTRAPAPPNGDMGEAVDK